ncbi:MAG: tyrosine-type recombinase/integrase [Geminicoccaceae bacterium]
MRSAHKTACGRAGITDFRLHGWRHHFASWAVMKGIDIETIKKMDGWKSLRMLERFPASRPERMSLDEAPANRRMRADSMTLVPRDGDKVEGKKAAREKLP